MNLINKKNINILANFQRCQFKHKYFSKPAKETHTPQSLSADL